MPARRCTGCDLNFPTGKGRVHCPSCGEALIFSSHETPDTTWPDEVDVDKEVADGWAKVRAEYVRRQGTFSMADLIGEQDPSDRTA